MRDITPTNMRGSKWMLFEDDAGHVWAFDSMLSRKMQLTVEDMMNALDVLWFEKGQHKRKVKSERWFAVYKGGRDGTFWSSDCDTEEFARKVYPHALTYVRAECEVEID